MKANIYSLYDSAAKAYTTPFFLSEDGLAIRTFSDNINSQNESNLSKHPDQFTLFKLAEFDDTNGTINTLDAPLSLANGLELQTTPSITLAQFEELQNRLTTLEQK